MDKFGIFKLLNSFFNFNNQKESSDPPSNASNLDNNNVLSKLLSSINNNNNILKGTPPQKLTEKPTDAARNKPLQASMLKTMNSHDEFIKRVKEKNTQ